MSVESVLELDDVLDLLVRGLLLVLLQHVTPLGKAPIVGAAQAGAVGAARGGTQVLPVLATGPGESVT